MENVLGQTDAKSDSLHGGRSPLPGSTRHLGTFDAVRSRPLFILGPICYNKGFLNLRVDASRFFGKGGEPIHVRFSNGAESVISKINRTANRTDAVKAAGGNSVIAKWFQKQRKGTPCRAGWLIRIR